jgi:hypothetical protein
MQTLTQSEYEALVLQAREQKCSVYLLWPKRSLVHCQLQYSFWRTLKVLGR